MVKTSAEPPSVRPSAQAYALVVMALGGFAIAASLAEFLHQPTSWILEWVKLALLVIVSGWLTIRLPHVNATVSLAAPFVFLAAIVFGASGGTLAVALEAIVISINRRYHGDRLPWPQVAFNLTALPLSMWLTSQAIGLRSPLPVDHVLGLGFIASIAALAAMYFLLSTGVLAVGISLQKGRRPLRVWRENFTDLWVMFAAGASLAVLLLLVGNQGRGVNLITVGLIIPFLVLIRRVLIGSRTGALITGGGAGSSTAALSADSAEKRPF